jgi:hypothetical protein
MIKDVLSKLADRYDNAYVFNSITLTVYISTVPSTIEYNSKTELKAMEAHLAATDSIDRSKLQEQIKAITEILEYKDQYIED